METAQEITRLLADWRRGNRPALDALIPAVMPELKRLAAAHLARERNGHTLQPTALVHEAYLRLAAVEPEDWRSRAHFYALAAQMMRRILVDYARARKVARRGGEWNRVTFDANIPGAPDGPGVLRLSDALDALAATDPRKARLLELRLFGGLSTVEAAEVLGISGRTAVRDWAFAKAWLAQELGLSV